MYDKDLVVEILSQIATAPTTIATRFEPIKNIDKLSDKRVQNE
jgi:hypothetical protein